MKLKMKFIALCVLALSFIANVANAQVRARVVIGGHPRPAYYHRTYARPYYGYHHPVPVRRGWHDRHGWHR